MSGRTISDADRKLMAQILGESGKTISDADRERVKEIMGMREPKGGMARKKITPFETGGEVPSKLKGFSKLPEPVQQKMNPSLAKKYEQGGEVKGHSRGGRAAIAGTKFIGVR
jgi:hypothetical protein